MAEPLRCKICVLKTPMGEVCKDQTGATVGPPLNLDTIYGYEDSTKPFLPLAKVVRCSKCGEVYEVKPIKDGYLYHDNPSQDLLNKRLDNVRRLARANRGNDFTLAELRAGVPTNTTTYHNKKDLPKFGEYNPDKFVEAKQPDIRY